MKKVILLIVILMCSVVSASDIVFEDGDLKTDTDTLYVDSVNDRVGIGTDSPAANLHVYSASGAFQIINTSNGNAGLTLGAGTTGQYPYIKLQHGGANYWELGSHPGYSQGFYLYSFKKTGGAANVFMVNKEGNVGIGTSSPSYLVDAQTTTNTRGLNVFSNVASGAGTYYGGVIQSNGANSGKNIGLYVNAGNAATNYGIIVEDGLVGIGTNTPDQKLKVIGNVNVTGDIYLGGNVTSYSPLMMGTDHDRGYTTQCWVNEDAGYTLVWFSSSGLQSDYNSTYCSDQAEKKAVYQQHMDEGIDYGDIQKIDGEWQVVVNVSEGNDIVEYNQSENVDYGYGS